MGLRRLRLRRFQQRLQKLAGVGAGAGCDLLRRAADDDPAAAVAAVYAEGMARARKYPVTSYQVISAVPLLPGAGIYYTMSLGLNGSTQLALQRGFATAGIAGSIAAAILLVSSVVRLFTAQRKK